MKSLLLVIFSCIIMINCHAQDKLPSYGKIDKADLEMKDCSFDKGAVAVKLFDYGKMYYESSKTVYDYRVRIKILKESGLSYANVEIPYYSYGDAEKNFNIDACTYNLDDNGKITVTDVKKASIYIKKINKRFSRLIIAFTDVKVGSVIEYKYKLERLTPFSIKDWYFQDQIPTLYSEYITQIPALLKFKPQKFVEGGLDEKKSEFDDFYGMDNVKITSTDYIMRNTPGIRKVEFMGAPKDYEQRIEFQLTSVDISRDYTKYVNTDWTEIIKYFREDEDFGPQLTKDIDDLDKVISSAMRINDVQARTKFIFDTIRSHMNCIYDEGFLADDPLSKVWQRQNGSIAEINMILINVLNKCKIKTSPILFSSRDNGLVNKVYYSERQFNKLMAYIPQEKGFLVLDASDKVSHYKLTPEAIVNTSGFVIEGDGGRWVDVLDETHKYQMMVAVQGVIDEKGILKGECSVNCMDYARKERAEAYKKSADEFKQKYFIKPYPAVVVEDVMVNNLSADSLPFSQKIIFNTSLGNSGGYSYFNTNMFNDFDTNPFVEDERVADVDFGVLQEYVIYGNFTIPEGYSYETLPQDISMSMPDKSIQYTRTMSSNNNVLNMRIAIDFKTTFYPASSYPEFHEFYKKLMNSLNEQVVIKKK